jgi:hypothetical protein
MTTILDSTLLIVSVVFHVASVLAIAFLHIERNWWRREAEGLQMQAWKTNQRLQQMIHDVEDTKEELTCWEMKAATLWGEMPETTEGSQVQR